MISSRVKNVFVDKIFKKIDESGPNYDVDSTYLIQGYHLYTRYSNTKTYPSTYYNVKESQYAEHSGFKRSFGQATECQSAEQNTKTYSPREIESIFKLLGLRQAQKPSPSIGISINLRKNKYQHVQIIY